MISDLAHDLAFGLVAESAENSPQIVTAVFMGQSEIQYVFDNDGAYRAITQPTPGPGNLIVFLGATTPQRIQVNAATVAAGLVNPALTALSAFLNYVEPGVTFVLGDGAVAGTSRKQLADDTETERTWEGFADVCNAIEAEFGSVQLLVECWWNADATSVSSFENVFWPFYFASLPNGSNFTLGTSNGDYRVDHCLFDGQAVSGKGRGIFDRQETQWAVLTPMPFWNMPTDPSPEAQNFSAGNPRLSEPARELIHNLEQSSLAQSVGLQVGPSVHVCKFGGTSTTIHPDRGNPDGQILFIWPAAVALLRAAGRTIGEPEIVGIEGPTDGTYCDLLVNLPNGGNLTTLRALRSAAAPSPQPPHYQNVVGIEITRGATRRPVFKTSETSYPVNHRGGVSIVDSGSGSPRRGRVRITPESPFSFGNSVSYLRGQATGGLLEPRDLDARLYLNHLIEHVPAFYDSSALYPFEGIAVKPYQAELQVNVPAPPFTPRSTRFPASTGWLANDAMSFAGSSQGMLSFWFYVDAATWAASPICNVRDGSTIVFQVQSTSSNRLTFTLLGVTAYTVPTNRFSLNRWHHVLWSWKAGSGGWFDVYVDGIAESVTRDMSAVSLGINATLERFYLNTISGSTGATNAREFAYFYLNLQESLDIKIQANREKFLLGNNPVSLGGNGQLPTGNQPAFFLDGDAAFPNLGTAGSVPGFGTLTAGRVPALP